MFAESAFVPRRTAEKWVKEAREEQVKLTSPEPKLSWEERKNRHFAYYAQPAAVSEPQDIEARERAVIARFKASTPEQQAAMITEAAARSRPSKRK